MKMFRKMVQYVFEVVAYSFNKITMTKKNLLKFKVFSTRKNAIICLSYQLTLIVIYAGQLNQQITTNATTENESHLPVDLSFELNSDTCL